MNLRRADQWYLHTTNGLCLGLKAEDRQSELLFSTL